jgi:hypothetical protein
MLYLFVLETNEGNFCLENRTGNFVLEPQQRPLIYNPKGLISIRQILNIVFRK